MAIREQRKRHRPRRGGRAEKRPRTSDEPRLTENLTVGWMLSMLTALLCEAGALVAWLLAGNNEMLRVFAGYLFFAAMIVGLLSLALGIAVLKLRKVRPPLGITVFSFSVAALPLVLIVAAALFNVRP